MDGKILVLIIYITYVGPIAYFRGRVHSKMDLRRHYFVAFHFLRYFHSGAVVDGTWSVGIPVQLKINVVGYQLTSYGSKDDICECGVTNKQVLTL